MSLMISSPPTLPPPPPPPPKTPSLSMLNQFGQFNLPSPPALPPPAVSPPYPTLLLSPKATQMTSSLLLATTTTTPSKRLNELNDNTHSTHQLNSFGRSNTLDRKPRSTFSYETTQAKSRIDTQPQNSYFSNSLERSQPHGAEHRFEYQVADLVCTSPQRNSLNLVLKSPSSPPTCRVTKTNSVYEPKPICIMENAAYLVGFQNQPKLHQQHHQHTASTPTSPEFIISSEFGTQQSLKHELEAATCQLHKLTGQLHASVRVFFSIIIFN